jgi:hypothetical protein
MKTKIKTIIYLFKSLYRKIRGVLTEPDNMVHLSIKITLETYHELNRLTEKSGVRDMSQLMNYSFATFNIIVSHELHGGSVRLMDQNGIGGEDLDILEHINGPDDWWKHGG